MSFSVHGRQVWSLLLLFLTGWSLTMSGGRDSWAAISIAAMAGLLLFALFCVPAEKLGTSWTETMTSCFGALEKPIIFLLCAFAFWGLCMAVLSYAIFLRTSSDELWPVWLIAASLLTVAGFAAAGGAERLALWAEPMVWIVLASIVLSLVLTMPDADFGNLRPILADGWNGIKTETFMALSVPFAECWFAVSLLGDRSTQLRNSGLAAVVTAGILLSLTALRNIAVLGQAGAQGVWYPTFTAAGLIELGETFQRGEVLVSGSLLICGAARAAVFLCFIADGAKEIVPRASRMGTVTAVGILCAVLCSLTAGSTLDFQRAEMLYRLIALPVIILVAVMTAALAAYRAKNGHEKNAHR